MGFFDAFRTKPFPTIYEPNKTAVTVDVLEAGLIYAICILALSFFVILPGIRHKQRLFAFIKIVFGLFILAAIMLCNFGQEWEVAHIQTKTAYKSGLRGEVKADVGVKIGLRSVNITLKGDPVNQVNETINYNERFNWFDPWSQGRGGFGPFAGRVNREFREAQYKGLPYPILWIAEYFTLDGEGIRWGRHYRHAGFYTHIVCWLAFPLWILTIALSFMVLLYAGLCMTLTGIVLIAGNIIYASLRNVNELVIPFTSENKLVFTFGWCFWLNLVAGILCIVVGIIVVILSEFQPEKLAKFFGLDILNNIEEYYTDSRTERPYGYQTRRFTETADELGRPRKGRDDNDGANVDAGRSTLDENSDEDGNYENVIIEPRVRPRTTIRRVFGRKPVPMPRGQTKPAQAIPEIAEEDLEEVYVNTPGTEQARYNSATPQQVHIDMSKTNF